MNSKKKFIAVILITLFTLISCSKDEQVLTQSGGSQTIKKSPKRGLAYDLKDPADLDALKSGVSWWYNWYFKTTAPQDYYKTYQMEFIPMLWGHNSDADFTQAKEFILSHPEIKYLLVLNEPNLTDQANMTPYDAAEEWKKYESLVAELKNKDRTVYLVGPAMNWGTMSGYNDPVTWLDDFYTAYIVQNNNKLPQIDYLAFHWYDYGLEAQLDRLAKYGKKIWITEMANWNPQINSYEKQAEQMKQMVALCESRSDVFRYAWFIGRGAEDKYSNLFNAASGELNDLGKLYISLPY